MFEVKKDKVRAKYKTLYISEDLTREITKLAKQNKTSFNDIVIQMIEFSLRNRKKGIYEK